MADARDEALEERTIVHLPRAKIVNMSALADEVERAFALFDDEERKMLQKLPHDMDGAQRRCDKAMDAYANAVAPKSFLAMAVEILAARNEQLERSLKSNKGKDNE